MERHTEPLLLESCAPARHHGETYEQELGHPESHMDVVRSYRLAISDAAGFVGLSEGNAETVLHRFISRLPDGFAVRFRYDLANPALLNAIQVDLLKSDKANQSSATADLSQGLQGSIKVAWPFLSHQRGSIKKSKRSLRYSILRPKTLDLHALINPQQLRGMPRPLMQQDAHPDDAGLLLPFPTTLPRSIDAAIEAATLNTSLVVALCITIAPQSLDAHHLRVLSGVQQRLRWSLSREHRHSRSTVLQIFSKNLIELWFEEGRGLRYSAYLVSKSKIETALVDAVTECIFGNGLSSTKRLPDAMDLSTALPGARAFLEILPNVKAMARARHIVSLKTPRNRNSSAGLMLGNVAPDLPVWVANRDLERHVYIIGATGTGKSTLLANMIEQDVAAGHCAILIDPHGDLYRSVASGLAARFNDRLRLFDAGNLAEPFGLNPLEIPGANPSAERNFVCNQLVRLFSRSLYRGVPEAFGPIFESYFRGSLMLLMDAGGPDVTLCDLDRVFSDKRFRHDLLERCTDPLLERFWVGVAERASGDQTALSNIAPYILSKLTQLVGNPFIRAIISQPRSTMNFASVLSHGDVGLVNLAKGVIGEYDTALLGALVTMHMFTTALAQSQLPPSSRPEARVYLDEFQSYAIDSLADMLAEVRKFGLSCVLANQSLSQVDGHGYRADVADSILANVANILSFRIGPRDAVLLAPWFGADLPPRRLMALNDFEVAARILQDGVPQHSFLFKTEPH